jgi:hypothetical protein
LAIYKKGGGKMACDEVVNSHVTGCMATEKSGEKALSEPENIVVVVFKSGRTVPLCRHLKYVSELHVCNPNNIKSDKIMDYGDCHFSMG